MTKETSILECVDIVNDRVLPYEGTRKYLDTGGLNVDVVEEIRKFEYGEKPSRANQNVKTNDILLARMKGTTKVKVISIEESNYIVSTGFLVLRAKTDTTDIHYLKHLFKSDFFQSRKDKLCTGATQKAINNTNFKKLKVPLPPLKEQNRISQILEKAYDYHKKTQTLLDKYNQLAHSVFLEMFGDPVSNPKDWEMAKGDNFYEVRGRVGWKGYKRSDLRDSGALVLGASHVDQLGNIDLSNPVFLSDEKYEESPEIKVKVNDIIFVQRGNTIAKCGLVRKELGRTTINPVVLILRPRKDISLFLLYLLMNKRLKNKMVNFNSGSAQPMITQKQMKNIMLIKPDYRLIKEFEIKVQNIETQVNLLKVNSIKSGQLYNGILQKAFKGELTI